MLQASDRDAALARLALRALLRATPLLHPGRRIGEWTLLEYVPASGRSHAMWLCRCVCGTVRKVQRDTLHNGRSRSCGHPMGRAA